MRTKEFRRHKRLPLRLEVIYHILQGSSHNPALGRTVNVSTGGLLMEVNHKKLHVNDLISLELSVPPTPGLLEYGGRIAGYGRVKRIELQPINPEACNEHIRRRIAVKFCGKPHLAM